MERLIVKKDNKYVTSAEANGFNDCCIDCFAMIDKLGLYEDTELSPAEITKLRSENEILKKMLIIGCWEFANEVMSESQLALFDVNEWINEWRELAEADKKGE